MPLVVLPHHSAQHSQVTQFLDLSPFRPDMSVGEVFLHYRFFVICQIERAVFACVGRLFCRSDFIHQDGQGQSVKGCFVVAFGPPAAHWREVGPVGGTFILGEGFEVCFPGLL